MTLIHVLIDVLEMDVWISGGGMGSWMCLYWYVVAVSLKS